MLYVTGYFTARYLAIDAQFSYQVIHVKDGQIKLYINNEKKYENENQELKIHMYMLIIWTKHTNQFKRNSKIKKKNGKILNSNQSKL